MSPGPDGPRTATLIASAGRLGARYRESRQSFKPLFRLVLDVAALLSLLRRRSSTKPGVPTMAQP